MRFIYRHSNIMVEYLCTGSFKNVVLLNTPVNIGP